MATRFGLTWWGQRWIGALEALGALYANRLPRGRTYARRGAVTGLQVRPGAVSAKVAGRRARPYRVTLALPVFDDATWDAALAALAGELRHAAALLDGQMPADARRATPSRERARRPPPSASAASPPRAVEPGHR